MTTAQDVTPQDTPFGVHSEVGRLRKVMVCAPGRAHQRLTPSNCDSLLFDDVMWVENAKRDHFDFVQKMRELDIDVVEMHNLLAETVAVPEAKAWILDNQVVPNQVGVDLVDEVRSYLDGLDNRELAETLIGGLSTTSSPDPRRRDHQAGAGRRGGHRVPAPAVAEHPVHPRHHLLDLRRRHPQPAVLAGPARRDDPGDGHLHVPPRLRRQGQRVVGRPDAGLGTRHRSRAATSCRSATGLRAHRDERAHVTAGASARWRRPCSNRGPSSGSLSRRCPSCGRRCTSTPSSPSPTATACCSTPTSSTASQHSPTAPRPPGRRSSCTRRTALRRGRRRRTGPRKKLRVVETGGNDYAARAHPVGQRRQPRLCVARRRVRVRPQHLRQHPAAQAGHRGHHHCRRRAGTRAGWRPLHDVSHHPRPHRLTAIRVPDVATRRSARR